MQVVSQDHEKDSHQPENCKAVHPADCGEPDLQAFNCNQLCVFSQTFPEQMLAAWTACGSWHYVCCDGAMRNEESSIW